LKTPGEHDVVIRDLRIHLCEAGHGPLVLMLHGFPEFSYEWRRQLPVIAAAGFRVVAPDQRGYALSDKPRRRCAYRVEELAADVAALIETCGEKSATVVGHDWGGIVAYYTAMLHPDRVDKLVILNAPHPAQFDRVLRRNPRQLLRSWYGAFFMLPVIPELLFRAGRWFAIRRILQRDAAAGAFTSEDIERYVEAWSQPGTTKATIDWYRALAYRRPGSLRHLWRPVDTPTLTLWGDRDRYLLPELAEPTAEWVPNRTTIRFPEASHWLPHDEPDRVSDEIIKFIR